MTPVDVFGEVLRAAVKMRGFRTDGWKRTDKPSADNVRWHEWTNDRGQAWGESPRIINMNTDRDRLIYLVRMIASRPRKPLSP